MTSAFSELVNANVHIISKGGYPISIEQFHWLTSYPVTLSYRKNIGREGETYLGYIIENYPNFADYILFTQAAIFRNLFLQSLNFNYNDTRMNQVRMDIFENSKRVGFYSLGGFPSRRTNCSGENLNFPILSWSDRYFEYTHEKCSGEHMVEHFY